MKFVQNITGQSVFIGPFRRPRCMCGGLRLNKFKRNRFVYVVWIQMAQDRVKCSDKGNEPSHSIKDGKFLDLLSDCQLAKNISALWS
jgi:hypothetical protein